MQRAGVNERMIYHHFGSKDGLYTAVVEQLRQSGGEQWRPILERTGTMQPHAGLTYALAGFYDLIRNRPELPAIFAHEWLAGIDASPFPTPEQLPHQLRTLYDTGQRDGVFTADRPFEIAYMTSLGALIGLTFFAPRFHAGVPGSDLAPDLLRDHIVGQLVDGLTGTT